MMMMNKYLTNLVFSVRTVNYGPLGKKGKNAGRNLQYGPRTRLVRGIQEEVFRSSVKRYPSFTFKQNVVRINTRVYSDFKKMHRLKTTVLSATGFCKY